MVAASAPAAVWNPDEPGIRQPNSWTCSTTSLTWLLHALGRGPSVAWITEAMGTGISQANGLEDATGAGLAALVNREYGEMFHASSRQEAMAWAEVLSALRSGLHLCIGGAAWYHWVALRGCDDSTLYLMNPAGSYKGISDTLNETQFRQMGPFHALMVQDLRSAPPSDLERRVAALEAKFARLTAALTES